MQETAIRLKNISKSYRLYPNKQAHLKEALHPFGKKYHRPFMALNNINLDIPKGSIVGILGKNGAGKTTLLQVISSILTPSSGSVQVNGKIVALHQLGAGFNANYTGLQNIYFYGAVMGLSRDEIREKEAAIIDFAEIGDFIHQPVKTYSSGMKARLAFAVATEIDPEILILDEVLSVGDELFRRKCYARMEKFFKGGKTILFVSHSVQSINQICNQAILLDRGEVILEGPTKIVTTWYRNFLFSEKVNSQNVREEITALNQKGKLEKHADKKSARGNIAKAAGEKQKNEKQKSASNAAKQSDFYIPHFKSKSTKIEKNDGASIFDIAIKTINNKQVNNLTMHNEYILSYKVLFNKNAKNVFFSYLFKNEKGIFINNGHAPEKPLKDVKIGDQYLVEWHFSCLLVPQNYYVDVGTDSIDSKNGFIALGRVLDSIVFKVVSEVELKTGGMVSLKERSTVTRLKNHH